MGRQDRTISIGGILLMCLGIGLFLGYGLKWTLDTILRLS